MPKSILEQTIKNEQTIKRVRNKCIDERTIK